MKEKYFVASNSADGFCSYYDNAFNIEKLSIARYKLSFIDKNINVFYIEKNTYLCKKKMQRIIKNINAPLE
mgnify:CR=1 FL=1